MRWAGPVILLALAAAGAAAADPEPVDAYVDAFLYYTDAPTSGPAPAACPLHPATFGFRPGPIPVNTSTVSFPRGAQDAYCPIDFVYTVPLDGRFDAEVPTVKWGCAQPGYVDGFGYEIFVGSVARGWRAPAFGMGDPEGLCRGHPRDLKTPDMVPAKRHTLENVAKGDIVTLRFQVEIYDNPGDLPSPFHPDPYIVLRDGDKLGWHVRTTDTCHCVRMDREALPLVAQETPGVDPLLATGAVLGVAWTAGRRSQP